MKRKLGDVIIEKDGKEIPTPLWGSIFTINKNTVLAGIYFNITEAGLDIMMPYVKEVLMRGFFKLSHKHEFDYHWQVGAFGNMKTDWEQILDKIQYTRYDDKSIKIYTKVYKRFQDVIDANMVENL